MNMQVYWEHAGELEDFPEGVINLAITNQNDESDSAAMVCDFRMPPKAAEALGHLLISSAEKARQKKPVELEG